MDPIERAKSRYRSQIALLEEKRADYALELRDAKDKGTKRRYQRYIREVDQKIETLKYGLNFLENAEEE